MTHRLLRIEEFCDARREICLAGSGAAGLQLGNGRRVRGVAMHVVLLSFLMTALVVMETAGTKLMLRLS